VLNNSTTTLVFPLFSVRKDYDYNVKTFLSLKIILEFLKCVIYEISAINYFEWH